MVRMNIPCKEEVFLNGPEAWRWAQPHHWAILCSLPVAGRQLKAFHKLLSLKTPSLCVPKTMAGLAHVLTPTLHACCRSVVSDPFMTPWTVACQAPLSMGFSRQEWWSGLPFPSPGDLPDPGIKPHLSSLLHRQVGSSPLVPPGVQFTEIPFNGKPN